MSVPFRAVYNAAMDATKRYSRCKTTKPLADYWRCRTKRDGLHDRCKACIKLAQIAYRATPHGRAKTLELERARRKKPSAKASRLAWKRSEAGRASARRYYASEKGKARHRRMYEKDRASGKLRARAAVGNAIKRGGLPRPGTLVCVSCGERAHSYHHHKGYDRPNHLEVIPLCAPCHKQADQKLSRTELRRT
jgi:hypothetical protein